jgi:ferrochelatase
MRSFATAAASMTSTTAATVAANSGKVKPRTGIVMMNMGGPSDPKETRMFLKRLFTDVDIIDLGGGRLQKMLGTFVSTRRTPRIEAQYKTIGGSPIRKWTNLQGIEMCQILDETRPESAPHKAYTCFRYVYYSCSHSYNYYENSLD